MLVLGVILAFATVLGIVGCAAGTTTSTSTAGQTTLSSLQTTTTTVGQATTTTVAQATTTSTSVPAATTSTTAASSAAHAALIKQTLQLARQGKVIDIPFVSGTSTIDEVQTSWGTATTEDSAGAGIYFTFTSRHAAFGINKGDQIFDVRSSSSQLQAVTLSEVTSTLGSPGILRHLSTQDILLYPAGPDYQLLWIFPAPSSAQPDPHVDHISVFYPAGTVDLMAQNVPNPSIVVSKAPGLGGPLFVFSIKDPPSAYTLAEVEWIPTSGPVVITTLPEAVLQGTSGGSGSYFKLGADGHTWSFVYASSAKGESGVVKLVYQNTNGAAIIGQSNPILLK